MKKQLSLLAIAAALISVAPAYSATNWGTRAGSSADLTNGPATRTRENVDYTKYQTRTTTKTYEVQDGKNMYYTQPSNRSALYKQYSSGNSSQTVRTTRSETVRTEMKRKYYLAHPFFQPLKGKFGSITDFGYNTGSYKFALNPIDTEEYQYDLSDPKAKWNMSQFAIKEDFSYGITDRIAVLGLLRYEMNKYKFDWSVAPDDEMDDNGLNMFGLGAQWRFVDTSDWIATASAYFQHQKDLANNFILDLKAGYKVSRSTIYGLARAWYVDFDGDFYGNGVTGTNKETGRDETLFIAYNDGDDHAFYVEGGLGVFSVLDEDWTLNVEGIFGHYDWHNQFSIKGAIGWQPNDWFALNLYAKTTLFDSADDQKLDFWWKGAQEFDASNNPTGNFRGWDQAGTAKISDYNETSVGLQVIFQF